MKAFPLTEKWNNENLNGMDLRDYFAAKALQAIIGTDRAAEFVDENGNEDSDGGTLFIHTEFLAHEAYMIADFMMEVRKK